MEATEDRAAVEAAIAKLDQGIANLSSKPDADPAVLESLKLHRSKRTTQLSAFANPSAAPTDAKAGPERIPVLDKLGGKPTGVTLDPGLADSVLEPEMATGYTPVDPKTGKPQGPGPLREALTSMIPPGGYQLLSNLSLGFGNEDRVTGKKHYTDPAKRTTESSFDFDIRKDKEWKEALAKAKKDGTSIVRADAVTPKFSFGGDGWENMKTEARHAGISAPAGLAMGMPFSPKIARAVDSIQGLPPGTSYQGLEDKAGISPMAAVAGGLAPEALLAIGTEGLGALAGRGLGAAAGKALPTGTAGALGFLGTKAGLPALGGAAVGLNQSNNQQLAADIREPGVEHPFNLENVGNNLAISGAFGLGAGLIGKFGNHRVASLRDPEKHPGMAQDIKELEAYAGKPVTNMLGGIKAPPVVKEQYAEAAAEMAANPGSNVVAGSRRAQEAGGLVADELKSKLESRKLLIDGEQKALYSKYEGDKKYLPVAIPIRELSERLKLAGEKLGDRLEDILKSHGGAGDDAEKMLYTPQRLDDTIDMLGSRETGGLSADPFQGKIQQLTHQLREYRKEWPGFAEMSKKHEQIMERSKAENIRLGLNPKLTDQGVDQGTKQALESKVLGAVSGTDRNAADAMHKPFGPEYTDYKQGYSDKALQAARDSETVRAYERLMGKVDLDVGTTSGLPPGVRLGYSTLSRLLPRADPAFRAMGRLDKLPAGAAAIAGAASLNPELTSSARNTAALMPWVAKLLEMGGVPVAKTDDKPAKSK